MAHPDRDFLPGRRLVLAGVAAAIGLPASVLVDREGREIGRLLGPADWNSSEAERLIRSAIAEAGPIATKKPL